MLNYHAVVKHHSPQRITSDDVYDIYQFLYIKNKPSISYKIIKWLIRSKLKWVKK